MPSLVAEHAYAWWIRVQWHADAAVLDPDPVHIHQFRTHLRRIRSLQSHLKSELPNPPSAEVRATLRAVALRTGPLRDLDVLLAARDAWLAALPPDLEAGGREVWKHFENEREQAQELVEGYLAGDHFRGQRLATDRALPVLFADPGGSLDLRLWRSVARQHRKVVRAADKFSASTPPARWHRLRIQAKKLRYGLEVCPPGEARTELLRILKRLQTALGNYNDLAVQQLLVRNAADREWSPAALQAVGAWRRWLHGEQQRQHPALPEALTRYARRRTARLVAVVSGGQP